MQLLADMGPLLGPDPRATLQAALSDLEAHKLIEPRGAHWRVTALGRAWVHTMKAGA